MEKALWIDGRWCPPQVQKCLDVENPATEEIIDQVANAGAADVALAVRAAKTAFEDGRWSGKTPGQRSAVLLKMADLVEERAAEIARIESEDSGKPYQNVSLEADLAFSVDNLRFFAAAARDTGGITRASISRGPPPSTAGNRAA